MRGRVRFFPARSWGNVDERVLAHTMPSSRSYVRIYIICTCYVRVQFPLPTLISVTKFFFFLPFSVVILNVLPINLVCRPNHLGEQARHLEPRQPSRSGEVLEFPSVRLDRGISIG
ncbi:hypothetical protein F4820DRAFT_404239 [Hypoxylon rubiginosum]|uniref:Uncharacterized protein n=1 Tax=Hypoxylon rubiginosum TaxID=110542 RepID=A0ACB9ZGU3_9PEZI|nr:hypothetical protein F4820DRAFT_404239 [Hypoxylon rubiginosum]